MIVVKSQRELNKMRTACRITAETHALLAEKLAPGVSTGYLDQIAEDYILNQGAVPAFKGYRGFPSTLCVAINEEVVHGIPGSRILKEGDIIGLDIGVKKDGFYGDAAQTLPVGKISSQAEQLLKTAREALSAGIEQAFAGNYLSDISHAVQVRAEKEGFSVVRRYVGHGIGRKMHEDPQVPNFGPPGQGVKLKAGMTLAIEPMVNLGVHEVEVLEDGWTVVTSDRMLSAHFEHTVVVKGSSPPEILTLI